MCSFLCRSRLLSLKCLPALENSCNFSSSQISLGRKSRDPYDKRFGLHVLDAGPDKPGGSVELQEKLLRGPEMPRRPGVYDVSGAFHFVPEMVPEFVIPDLSKFKLKPYVSYNVKTITQNEFTPEDLFKSTYAKQYIQAYKSGEIDFKTLEEKIQQLKRVEN